MILLRSPVSRLMALMALADFLFWGHALGLSLAVYTMAIFFAALASPPRPLALASLGLAVLPIVEFVQALSLAILVIGLLTALTLQHRPLAFGPALASLLRQLPRKTFSDLCRVGRLVEGRDVKKRGRGMARAWALPIGGFLVLSSLLVGANPVLAQWLSSLGDMNLDLGDGVLRALFWAGIACLCWPLIAARPQLSPPLSGQHRSFDANRFGLNPASVGNALALFNAGLALQNVMDLRYLWQGVTPDGMTLASYAHRGAYPLFATALLAGAFALAARPFVAQRNGVRRLLFLWLGQNVVLTISALYRLDLYIQSYGLTYLRTHAAIWMVLVALGLCLTVWQVAKGHGASWLLLRCGFLGAATLYLCAFVNFADLIARTNLRMGKIDSRYLCELGPTAAASLPEWVWDVPGEEYDLSSRNCRVFPPEIGGWREWGFRNWRVLHNLQQKEAH